MFYKNMNRIGEPFLDGFKFFLHQRGGEWSTKDLVENPLKKVVGTTKLNYEEIETFEIERVINSLSCRLELNIKIIRAANNGRNSATIPDLLKQYRNASSTYRLLSYPCETSFDTFLGRSRKFTYPRNRTFEDTCRILIIFIKNNLIFGK